MTKTLRDIPVFADNALSEDRTLYAKTNFRDRYFEALRSAQIFEMLLHTLFWNLVSIGSSYFESINLKYEPSNTDNMTINDYLNRIKTFFPVNENKMSYDKLVDSQSKRNKFIHSSFKVEKGRYFAINLDIGHIHQDANASKKLEDWENSFRLSYPILIKWLSLVDHIRKNLK